MSFCARDNVTDVTKDQSLCQLIKDSIVLHRVLWNVEISLHTANG